MYSKLNLYLSQVFFFYYPLIYLCPFSSTAFHFVRMSLCHTIGLRSLRNRSEQRYIVLFLIAILPQLHLSLGLCNGCLIYFREYPCDHVAMLNLALLNVGNPRMPTHETAVQLLHLLDRRFFQEESVLRDKTEQHQPLNDVFLSVSYCRSQIFLSDQLARLHPELTMPMFSGMTVVLVVNYTS